VTRPARVAAFVLVLALAASAAGADGRGAARAALLDVPYLSQPVRLCGGAAVSMVLRYWGARDVFPQDFAPLVDGDAEGIRASVLAEAVARRGWQTLVFDGQAPRSDDWLAVEIERGRPVIAMIEDRPGTYHYVVVVGATPTDVIYHDPARAPFRTMPRAEFERAWTAGGRWTLVILPSAEGPVSIAAAPPVPASASIDGATAPASPCASLIARHVTLARDGALNEAERGLTAATNLCPGDGRAHLELAGVRFLQQRYQEAEALAERSADLAPPVATTWDLIATSRYLQGDLPGALDAWNRIDRPRADIVSVEGPERLDHPIAVRAIGLEPRRMITASNFRRAERRLRDLPSIKDVALHYEPAGDGTARVRAVLDERSVLPRGLLGWGAVGVNAAFKRELRIPVSNAFRQGEVWDVRYRWKENRPRFRIGFVAPSPGPLPGVIAVEGLWERQAYRPVDAPRREERRRIGVSLSDWATGNVRWTIGGAADQFDDRKFVAAQGLLDTRWLGDRLAASASLGYWRSTHGAEPFATTDAQMAWRSTTDAARAGFTVAGGAFAVHADSPLAVWPVAGSGESRGPLLRGHELHDRGVIVSETFGQRLAFATGEYRHPVFSKRGATAAIAGFVDVSRAWRHPVDDALLMTHVDVGVGLRLVAPGSDEALRLDIGYGLRDGRSKFSAGYIVPWGR
jgi:hypothetical protein